MSSLMEEESRRVAEMAHGARKMVRAHRSPPSGASERRPVARGGADRGAFRCAHGPAFPARVHTVARHGHAAITWHQRRARNIAAERRGPGTPRRRAHARAARRRRVRTSGRARLARHAGFAGRALRGAAALRGRQAVARRAAVAGDARERRRARGARVGRLERARGASTRVVAELSARALGVGRAVLAARFALYGRPLEASVDAEQRLDAAGTALRPARVDEGAGLPGDAVAKGQHAVGDGPIASLGASIARREYLHARRAADDQNQREERRRERARGAPHGTPPSVRDTANTGPASVKTSRRSACAMRPSAQPKETSSAISRGATSTPSERASAAST